MVCFIAPRGRAVKRARAFQSENPVPSACYHGDRPVGASMQKRSTKPIDRRTRIVNTAKTPSRPETNLVARYNPVAIRAVVAAALLAKVRQNPAK